MSDGYVLFLFLSFPPPPPSSDFQTSTLKLLRTVVNSSLEMAQMVVNTMGSFDTEAEAEEQEQ